MTPSTQINGLQGDAPNSRTKPRGFFWRGHLDGFRGFASPYALSDGNFSRRAALEGARCGLVAMALTDHDTVEGCPRMAKACKDLSIEVDSGVGIDGGTGWHRGAFDRLLHGQENPLLQSELLKFQAARQNRIHEMVARLNKVNVRLRAETVFGAGQLPLAGPTARRPGAGAGRLLRQPGRGVRAFFEKEPARLGPKHRISALDAMALSRKPAACQSWRILA